MEGDLIAEKSSSSESRKDADTDQPSTSALNNKNSKTTPKSDDRDEIVKMWRHIDEKLEDKAKSLNVNAINVKSILHHIIKYPHVISALMGLEGVPDRRLTRSHKKNAATPETDNELGFDQSKVKPLQEFRRVVKTFLNVNYENDDEDDDYQPEEDDDTNQMPSDAESDEEEEEDTIVDMTIDDPFSSLDDEMDSDAQYHFRSRKNLNDSLVNDDPCQFETFDNFHESAATEVQTTATPEYLDFISAIQRTENSDMNLQIDDDDPEDEDYNVLADGIDFDEENLDEFRFNRSTEISRREVEGMFMDIIWQKQENAESSEKQSAPDESIQSNNIVASLDESLVKVSKKKLDEEVIERIKSMPADESCSLIAQKPVTFRQCELDQLREQLKQHVQLLTQTVVICYYDENFQHLKDASQLMINTLDEKYYKYGESSMFNISNLAASIVSCHDIRRITQLSNEEARWAYGLDAESLCGYSPRPEAIIVLSRSEAILYPSLLPKVQPRVIDVPRQNFLPSEDLMLALALLQFAHLPRKSGRFSVIDRYSCISDNCLPTRPPHKIRNHLKSLRSCHIMPSPLLDVVLKAEQGINVMTFVGEKRSSVNTTLENWPSDIQPLWYRKFIEHFAFKSPNVVYQIVNTPSFPLVQAVGQSVVIVQNDVTSNQDSKIVLQSMQDVARPSTSQENSEVSNKGKEDELVQIGMVGDNQTAVMIDKKRLQEMFAELLVQQPKGKTITQEIFGNAVLQSIVLQGQDVKNREEAEEQRPIVATAQNTSSVEESANRTKLVETTAESTEVVEQVRGDVEPEIENTPAKRWKFEDDTIRQTPTTAGDELSNFFVPRTPGARPLSPSEFSCDNITTQSCFDVQASMGATFEIPRTPRGYVAEEDSLLCDSARKVAQLMKEDMFESETEKVPISFDFVAKGIRSLDYDLMTTSGEESNAPPMTDDIEEVEAECETKKDIGLAQQRRKKRSRVEKEEMGALGFSDEGYRHNQKLQLSKKIASDLKQRMFMHQEMWTSLQRILADETLTEMARVELLESTLSSLPDVLTLVLLLVPEHLLSSNVLLDERRAAYKGAFEMMMDIEAYTTAMKVKQPTTRQIFKFIAGLADENISSEEAAARLFQLIGSERPLWRRLQKYLHSEPYNELCDEEDFEFVDLKRHQGEDFRTEDSILYETIDDLDAVLGPSKSKCKGPLQVNRGQLMASQKGTFVPVEVKNEPKVKWTREIDVLLLRTFNAASSTEEVVRIVKSKSTAYSADQLEKRLEYLLTLF